MSTDHAPTVIGIIGIDAYMTLSVFSAGAALTTVKVTGYRAELKATFLGKGKAEESHGIGYGKPTQSVELLRNLMQVKHETNPQPLVHWPGSQHTQPGARPFVVALIAPLVFLMRFQSTYVSASARDANRF